MIIRLLGTNGSGKSHIVFGLFALCQPRRIFGMLGPRHPEANELKLPGVEKPLYIIGPYVTQCGGCDAIREFDNIGVLIKKYMDKGHVLFEGVLAGSTYGRLGDIMKPYGKQAVWVFLSTSKEECIARVEARRKKAHNDREFNPTNLSYKHDQVLRVLRRIRDNEDKANMVAMWVSSDQGAKAIVELLNGRVSPKFAPPLDKGARKDKAGKGRRDAAAVDR